MDATWIVSANAGRVRLFSQANAAAPLEEMTDMVNSDVRLRMADMVSDQIGPLAASKSRHGVGAPTPSSDYEPNQSPADHQTELFARNLAGFFLQGHQEGRFGQLVLVASPEFLGVLRKALDPKLTALVKFEINKDYTGLAARELAEQLKMHAP